MVDFSRVYSAPKGLANLIITLSQLDIEVPYLVEYNPYKEFLSWFNSYFKCNIQENQTPLEVVNECELIIAKHILLNYPHEEKGH